MNSYKPIIYIATDNHPVFFEKLSSTIEEIDNLKLGEDWQKMIPGFATMVDATVVLTQLASTMGISTWKQSKDEVKIEVQSVDKAVKNLKKLNLERWKYLVESISLSSIPNDLKFPPGHPIPEHLYRVHPLKQKMNKYIPIETFDTMLYDEREAELIYLLTDLGATKITFQDITNRSNEYGANAEVKVIGAGGVGGKGEHKGNQSEDSSEVIKLRGKPWTPNMTIDREKYSWLSYEPSWESLVHTRLVGGASFTKIIERHSAV